MQLQQQLAPIWRAYKEQSTGSLSCIADLHAISAVLQYRRSCDQTRLSHILVYKKNRGKLIRLLTNGTGSNVSSEDPLRSTNWAEDGQPTVFPTFPQCSVNSPQTTPRPPWLHSQGCGLPVPHAKLSLAVVLPPSSEL